MQPLMPEAITLDKISLGSNNEVHVLRLDKIHAEISGNKWFKLKHYLHDAESQKKQTILTFGGAFSNHILATAAACRLYNFRSIGIIRGEEPKELSSTLKMSTKNGMKLYFTSRLNYKDKQIPPELFNDIPLHEIYIINEGGYGIMGAKGSAEIVKHFDEKQYTHICCAVGTGTMIAGLLNGSHQPKVIGISVLKNYDNHIREITELLDEKTRVTSLDIIKGYDFGGYGKYTPALLEFMNQFYQQTNIPTDFVYTGKLMFAVNDLIEKSFFKEHDGILIIHSGGLQGNNSIKEGKLMF